MEITRPSGTAWTARTPGGKDASPSSTRELRRNEAHRPVLSAFGTTTPATTLGRGPAPLGSNPRSPQSQPRSRWVLGLMVARQHSQPPHPPAAARYDLTVTLGDGTQLPLIRPWPALK
jgi:hypothetical protein